MVANQVLEVPAAQQPDLQQEARTAFARREKLSGSTRRQLSLAFGGGMTVKKAWEVVRAYAAGQIPEVGNAISQLTRAWLKLGNQKFDIIFGLVRAAAMVRNCLKSFATKMKELVTLPLRELKRRLRQAQSVEFSLRFSEVA